MTAAANGRFTVKIKTMTGTVIDIENMSMNSPVELLKGRLHTKYSEMGHNVPFHDMRLYYMTPGTADFIELVTGYLGEYNSIIDFRDDNTIIDMFLQPIETNPYPGALEDLFKPEYMVDVPDNATLVGEVSSNLIFKTIYIVNQQDDNKQGLRCTVRYISVDEHDKIIILDAHPKNEPEIRILQIFRGDISLIFLHPYVQHHLVYVENPVHAAVAEPAHGGRKNRTRRNRRTLLKKHRKNRKHRTHRKH